MSNEEYQPHPTVVFLLEVTAPILIGATLVVEPGKYRLTHKPFYGGRAAIFVQPKATERIECPTFNVEDRVQFLETDVFGEETWAGGSAYIALFQLYLPTILPHIPQTEITTKNGITVYDLGQVPFPMPAVG